MPISRRQFTVASALAGAAPLVHAHHGWSSFDQDRPVYLAGTVVQSRWRNPHAELVIETPATLALPADLRTRSLPAQTAGVDGPGLLAKAVLPTRRDRRWELELAPMTRMQAWKVEEIKTGMPVAALGFLFKDEKGEALMRVEYLFAHGGTYGLRSSPA